MTYDVGVEPEPAEPHLVTEDEDGRRAGLPVAGKNTPAEQRRDSEKLKRVVAHRVGVEGLQPIARAHKRRRFPHGHRVGEDPVLPLIIQKLRNREVVPVLRSCAVRFDNPESVDALAVGIRERVQQYVIDDAEDRRRRTDSQSESGHAGEEKSMIVAEAPNGEAQVLPKQVHIGSVQHLTAQSRPLHLRE